MAETLGSLVDKLTIVDLKLWHCQEHLFQPERVIEAEETTRFLQKNESLLGQRQRLIQEIDEWVYRAINDPESVVLTNPQNKMYGRFKKD